MAQTRPIDVAIVGGGLGGLALAAGLQERGFDVQLFEAAPELRTATSTLIGLGGNAFKALEGLSPQIMDRLMYAKQQDLLEAAICTSLLAVHLENYLQQCRLEGVQTREIRRTVQPHKYAKPQTSATEPASKLMTFRWAKVQNVLASMVHPERVHCGHRATSYTEVADGEGGHVLLHFKGGLGSVRARFVVAADGLKSSLRSVMLPQDTGPRYLGHMNFNALLYNPGGQETVDAHLPGQLKVFTDVASGMFNILCMVIDAGDQQTFWQVRIRSEQPSFTGAPPTNSSAACPAANDLAPPSSQQQGPLAPWELSPSGKQGEPAKGLQPDMPYLVGGGLGVPGSKARVLDILDKAGFQDVIRVVQATPEASIFERAILDRIPLDELPPWGDQDSQGNNAGSSEKSRSPLASQGNRVVLLGDALHAAHSGPGQGARTAFEDAHQLANILEAHSQELNSWKLPKALQPSVTRGDSCSQKGSDAEGLPRVVADYTKARLVRVCRMQRMAAEGSGLPHIREHARDVGVARSPGSPAPQTIDDAKMRWAEFTRWFESYPEHQSGLPDSLYWKPPV